MTFKVTVSVMGIADIFSLTCTSSSMSKFFNDKSPTPEALHFSSKKNTALLQSYHAAFSQWKIETWDGPKLVQNLTLMTSKFYINCNVWFKKKEEYEILKMSST